MMDYFFLKIKKLRIHLTNPNLYISFNLIKRRFF